jgi:hypothetical protein
MYVQYIPFTYWVCFKAIFVGTIFCWNNLVQTLYRADSGPRGVEKSAILVISMFACHIVHLALRFALFLKQWVCSSSENLLQSEGVNHVITSPNEKPQDNVSMKKRVHCQPKRYLLMSSSSVNWLMSSALSIWLSSYSMFCHIGVIIWYCHIHMLCHIGYIYWCWCTIHW